MNFARTSFVMLVRLVRRIFRVRSNQTPIDENSGQLTPIHLLAPETRPYIAL